MHETRSGPGVVSPILFALALTRIDSAHAGREHAAYARSMLLTGSVYPFTAALAVGCRERTPDHWDLGVGAVCVTGGVILSCSDHVVFNSSRQDPQDVMQGDPGSDPPGGVGF